MLRLTVLLFAIFVRQSNEGFTEWNNFSPCTRSCDGGSRVRTRACNPSLAGTCVGPLSESQSCNVQPCPSWTQWTPWSVCSETCGPGQQRQTRNCIAGGGGPACPGPSFNQRFCINRQCTGEWGNWTPWTPCSQVCGPGKKRRTRVCIGGTACIGNLREENVFCTKEPCPIGNWTPWGAWTSCSATCGSGRRTRARNCVGLGSNCPGVDKDFDTCIIRYCIIGQWNNWLNWSPCSKTCGTGGTRQRSRTCLPPSDCPPGNKEERLPCFIKQCPVGDWAGWTNWTPCSPCGPGKQNRNRVCIGGECLAGLRSEGKACFEKPCGIGSWNNWVAWTPCSATCGPGSTRRTRVCVGGSCPGLDLENRSCFKQSCTIGTWALWAPWTTCIPACGSGTKRRTRVCTGPGTCPGLGSDQTPCTNGPCGVGNWNVWQPWSTCSQTCGQGLRSRRRTCVGGSCPGETTMNQACNDRQCTSSWAVWTQWSPCTPACGAGIKRRTRSCSGGAPNTCPGTGTEQTSCTNGPCGQGTWTIWTPWSTCSPECGQGSRKRTRSCNGGAQCPGSREDSQSCTNRPCPISNGNWNNWTPWTACVPGCGPGSSSRVRICQGGIGCLGDSIENRGCTNGPCGGAVVPRPNQNPNQPVDQFGSEARAEVSDGPADNPTLLDLATWVTWLPWTPCDSLCGPGKQQRIRHCIGIGKCIGPKTESRSCGNGACPVNVATLASLGRVGSFLNLLSVSDAFQSLQSGLGGVFRFDNHTTE